MARLDPSGKARYDTPMAPTTGRKQPHWPIGLKRASIMTNPTHHCIAHTIGGYPFAFEIKTRATAGKTFLLAMLKAVEAQGVARADIIGMHRVDGKYSWRNAGNAWHKATADQVAVFDSASAA